MASLVYLVQDLVDQVRIDSDLALSQVYDDSQLATVISDAGSSLRDVFTGTNQYYDVSTFDFTLQGGVGLNSVTLPQDFQAGHSIDINPDTQQPFTLRYLPNWLNRNSFSLPFQVFGNNFGPKAYTFLGNEIVVLPAVYAQGIYRLYYTPTWTPVMIPQPPPGPTPVLTGFEAGGLVDFTGTTFTAANIGDTMISVGDGNSANNFTAKIIAVASATVVQVDSPLATEGSPTATITIQPLGTRSDLPQNMNPWIQYIKTQACITVRRKRGQPIGAFEAKLAADKDRIQVILQDRKEEPNQPPLLRGNGSMFGDDGWGNW